MSFLKIESADKYYNRGRSNQLHVINRVSLELPSTGMIAIFGKSGCGKTTLLNAIGGLDKIDSGKITLFGKNLKSKPDELRNRYIGYIFQNYNLSKNQTVFENVADALRLCGMPDGEEMQQRVIAALSNVRMEKFRDRFPDSLSGGQQQRVAIARALVKNPPLILADEPTGNLDENNTVMVMDILKELSKTNLVLLVTHEADLVDYYCDRVIEVSDGSIVNVRENAGTVGLVKKDKNDIYLGDLPKSEQKMPNVKLTYYGEPTAEIKLRVIHVDGKLYLKCDTPKVQFLNEKSEVRLREGSFYGNTAQPQPKSSSLMGMLTGWISGAPAEAQPSVPAPKEQKLDLSLLKPFTGKKYGKLFGFRQSLKLAWRENFSGKQKKGKKLLRVSLFFLSIVMVIMTATSAVNIKTYFDMKEKHNPNLFYLPLSEDGDYSALYDHMGENGIDYARIIGGSIFESAETISFRPGNFMTAKSSRLQASGNVMDSKLADNLKLLAGVKTFSDAGDVLITSALADHLIESAKENYIASYDDLIGMVSANPYFQDNSVRLRIVGVVESDEQNFYLAPLYSAYFILQHLFNNLPITPQSLQTSITEPIPAGTLVYNDYDGSGMNYLGIEKGKELLLLGRTFTVSAIEKYYSSSDFGNYAQWYAEKFGTELPEFEEYRSAHPEFAEYDQAYASYYSELVYPHFQEFIDRVKDNQEYYGSADFNTYTLWKNRDFLTFSIVFFGNIDLYAESSYQQKFGHYPTASELQAYLETDPEISSLDAAELQNGYYELYSLYQDSGIAYSKGYYGSQRPQFVLNDTDYQSLVWSAGKSAPMLNIYAFSTWQFGNDEDDIQYQNYMMIHASDPETANEYLQKSFGSLLISPDNVFRAYLKDSMTGIIGAIVRVGVVLGLMCLCIFFIMRSSFMSKVKEIGILRAIGTSKKNLIFRFTVETGFLTLMTTMVGFFASWWFIGSLSRQALFSLIFYFPSWMAIGLLVILAVASIFFGILPALVLLRRTPSEILSKYDI